MWSIRLKYIRIELDLTQLSMAEKLGISINTYKAYEQNKNNIPDDIKSILAEKLNINLHWLLTGSGQMFLETAESGDANLKRIETLHCPNCGTKLKIVEDRE